MCITTAAAKCVLTAAMALHPHPGHFKRSYVVHRGDTLEKIAQHEYGNRNLWPALWWTNRKRIHDPDELRTGERLRLSPWHPDRPWLTRAAENAIPQPQEPASAPNGISPVSSVPVVAMNSFQACVIARESGGNPRAVNPSSGAGGLYQFLPSTWRALGYGGSPQDAPVSVQNQAFQKEMATAGPSAWSMYDGC